MAQSSADSTLARLSQGTMPGRLKAQVRHLSKPRFIELLELIIQEFEYFLKAINLINNQSLETLLEELLEAFTLKIGQILQADRTTIFIVDEENQELWSKIAQGAGEKAVEIRIPMGKGIAGYVAETRKTLNIPSAYDDPRFNRATDEETGYHTKNILCMPIFSDGVNVVAVVQLLNKIGGNRFTLQDEKEFESFARSIGVLLESCNSFYTAARTQKGLNALLNAISSLEQSLELEVTLQSVMAEARKLMQADRSTLWLMDGNQLWSKVQSADGTELMELRQANDKDSIVGYVASTGETLNIPDAYKDSRFNRSADERTGYRTHSILCMPVFNSSGKIMGVTQLINKMQGAFTRSDESFMRAFNTQAGIALENAQLFENVLVEKQYQKDILQSLSDAVISTDMGGRIVTINETALSLLGCPMDESVIVEGESLEALQKTWEEKLIGRLLWEVVPIENLRSRLADSLEFGTHQYVPEQTLQVALTTVKDQLVMLVPAEIRRKSSTFIPREHDDTNQTYYLWGQRSDAINAYENVHHLEHSINLTVNPLTDPGGGVRGGLVVLEDISQEKRMKTTLYRYMTPSVADQVMALGEDSLMVGKRRDVTVLFSDIRGYTTLTERLEASQVVSMLNEYFETMVEAVFNHQGTLDKFIGDALMAVFGAPLPLENHGWSAVEAALDMRERLVHFNRSRQANSQPKINIGIGLSSGEVVSGNIGSRRKMEYTVIGDGVNLSSRLEGVTKQYGCDIVMSEHTYARCRDLVWVRELDLTRVKGKTKPVKIYELIGSRQNHQLDQATQDFLDLYKQARKAYTSQKFTRALDLFTRAKVMRPQDKAVSVHIARIHSYLENPPPADWDGVYVMTTK
ncbi:adenylate/guanylate cyclase domain-containing protein [Leptolyngbyaceae cyanobacterium CCMR0082]|uniref:Adenylate/guanylate cyclase domain-containing protein n=1 Tax=Adonisia turfae CCMR0082 TaxID=2304604 RepID=A0A6M0RZR9_9CYAN|nr:GAF domain-containing protein [Adonisia turfae]NEZ61718.1 adenylate/guanylate cyclase domain-containing protein [Adonisia turfae CCMR0082]